jgi:NAD(P)H dehydrogenase (quinone)
MNAFIVHAHPEPKSFNGALTHTAVATLRATGADVTVSDLYAMAFDPVSGRHNFSTVADADYLKLQREETHAAEHGGFASDIAAEMRKVEACDLMIWQFPLWWFGLPAILKGWADRVLAMGWAYGGGRLYEKGVFRGKRAMVSVTTGGPEASYGPDGFNGNIEAILRPIHRGIFEFTGFDVLAPAIYYGPARQTDDMRRTWLRQHAERLGRIEREAPIDVGRY